MQIPLDAHLKNRCTAVYCVQNRFVRLSVKPKYKLPKKTIQALVIASQLIFPAWHSQHNNEI